MYIRINDEIEHVRYMGNIINISRRHCRIGRVWRKPPKNLNGGWSALLYDWARKQG